MCASHSNHYRRGHEGCPQRWKHARRCVQVMLLAPLCPCPCPKPSQLQAETSASSACLATAVASGKEQEFIDRHEHVLFICLCLICLLVEVKPLIAQSLVATGAVSYPLRCDTDCQQRCPQAARSSASTALHGRQSQPKFRLNSAAKAAAHNHG